MSSYGFSLGSRVNTLNECCCTHSPSHVKKRSWLVILFDSLKGNKTWLPLQRVKSYFSKAGPQLICIWGITDLRLIKGLCVQSHGQVGVKLYTIRHSFTSLSAHFLKKNLPPSSWLSPNWKCHLKGLLMQRLTLNTHKPWVMLSELTNVGRKYHQPSPQGTFSALIITHTVWVIRD